MPAAAKRIRDKVYVFSLRSGDEMSASSAPKEVLVLRLLLAVPILNLFLKEALYGAEDAKYWFIANLAMIWAVSIYAFGYPAIILPALTLVPMAFLWILDVCR
ncbi:hypothetical protein LAB1_13160 [Roseibium sp. LAB1]